MQSPLCWIPLRPSRPQLNLCSLSGYFYLTLTDVWRCLHGEMWRGLKEGLWAFNCASYQQLASCKFLPAHAERATQQTGINPEDSDMCYLIWVPQQVFKIRTLNSNNNQQEPPFTSACLSGVARYCFLWTERPSEGVFDREGHLPKVTELVQGEIGPESSVSLPSSLD